MANEQTTQALLLWMQLNPLNAAARIIQLAKLLTPGQRAALRQTIINDLAAMRAEESLDWDNREAMVAALDMEN